MLVLLFLLGLVGLIAMIVLLITFLIPPISHYFDKWELYWYHKR